MITFHSSSREVSLEVWTAVQHSLTNNLAVHGCRYWTYLNLGSLVQSCNVIARRPVLWFGNECLAEITYVPFPPVTVLALWKWLSSLS